MRLLQRLLLLTACLVPLLPLWADPSPDETAARDELYQLRRERPEEYARLRHNLAWLNNLPAERRDTVIKLYRDLRSLRSSHRLHLVEVARRYADWLERLSADQRQKIEQIADSLERLKLVRQLREQQWVLTLPVASQKRLTEMKEDERLQEIQRLRLAERWWQRQWHASLAHWNELMERRPLPARLEDFPPDVQTYVNEYLKPMLSQQEKDKLEKAQGQWPLYPCTLVDLADQHPPALPGPHGPSHFNELPVEVQKRLQRGGAKKTALQLKRFEGRWPDYGSAVARLVKQQALSLPNELWPIRLEDLSQPMRDFVVDKLKPALDREELALLRQAEGTWPEFPKTIQELARRHYLRPPWQTLPGLTTRWEGYRMSGSRKS